MSNVIVNSERRNTVILNNVIINVIMNSIRMNLIIMHNIIVQ